MSDSRPGLQTNAYLAEYRQICWVVWDYTSLPPSACSSFQSAEFAVATSFYSSFQFWNLEESAKYLIH